MRGLGWCLVLLLCSCGIPLPKLQPAEPGSQIPAWPEIPPSQRLTIRGTLTIYGTEIPLTFRVLRGPQTNLRVIALDDLGGTFLHVTQSAPWAFERSYGVGRAQIVTPPVVLHPPTLPGSDDLAHAVFGAIASWLWWPLAHPNNPPAFDPALGGRPHAVRSADGRLGLLHAATVPLEHGWRDGALMLATPGVDLVDEAWIADQGRVQCTAQFTWKAGRWDTARIQDHKRDLQLDLQVVAEAEAQFRPEDFAPPGSGL